MNTVHVSVWDPVFSLSSRFSGWRVPEYPAESRTRSHSAEYNAVKCKISIESENSGWKASWESHVTWLFLFKSSLLPSEVTNSPWSTRQRTCNAFHNINLAAGTHARKNSTASWNKYWWRYKIHIQTYYTNYWYTDLDVKRPRRLYILCQIESSLRAERSHVTGEAFVVAVEPLHFGFWELVLYFRC